MRLSKISIKNFRGIKDLEVEFDRDITVLIGENNTGKTSVLEALRLCLDTIKTNKTSNFTEYDFHRNESIKELADCEPICITFYFFESAEYPWEKHITQTLNEVIVGSEYREIKLQVVAEYDRETGKPTQSWHFLDNADNKMTRKENMIRELRRVRPFFFQSALRAAKDQFHRQSTYWASFLNNKDIDDITKQQLEDNLTDVSQKIVDAHTSFSDIGRKIERLSDIVSVGKTKAVTFEPISADVYQVLAYTNVKLLSDSNANVPIRSHGEGTQSLAVLLLFSAYLNNRLSHEVSLHAEPIIAIEEPEAHLHPSATRAVWKILSDLPGQKIIATHSGEILSEVELPNIRKLNRNGEETQCKFTSGELLNEKELQKFSYHIRRNRGNLLFARFWILVEGETDVTVFSECAHLLGINLHAKGISLIECAQTGGPGVLIKIADALGIQWHLIVDRDDAGEKYANQARALLDARTEATHISHSTPNIEVILCCAGYGEQYINRVNAEELSQLEKFVPNSREYWEKVYSIVKNRISKPVTAAQSLELMRENGESGVPDEIAAILIKVVELCDN